jgi:hypothetical protein
VGTERPLVRKSWHSGFREHNQAMSNKFTVLLAVVAGCAGGIVSRYASPSAVHAQAPALQQEVRAQKFVLVDKSGAPRGAFGIETDGTVQIEITDNKGQPYLY